MNCDLWRSHGRIFAHWTCLYFFIVLVGRNFVSGICKLKPKNLKKTIFFCLKYRFFPALFLGMVWYTRV